MNKNLTFIFTLCALIVFLGRCKHEEIAYPQEEDSNKVEYPEPPSNLCDPDTVYFEQQVLKVLVSKCAMSGLPCHGEEPYQNGLNLTSWSAAINSVKIEDDGSTENEKFIIPGNSGESELYKKISQNEMPPDKYWDITSEEDSLIKKWIDQGAKNLRCNSCDDKPFESFDITIAPLLLENCAGCHNDSIPKDKIKDVVLFGYPPDLSNLNSGLADTIAGIIYREVNFSTLDPNSSMPRYIGKLYECDIMKFKAWRDSTVQDKL